MTRAPAVMFQGTGSNVGKSLVVAGICRALANRGLNVVPFKPQNMSNNAAVTEDGGEIGRAQALQAMACKRPLSVDMNPILLKPETDSGAQVVVQGRVHGRMRAREYGRRKAQLLPKVLESYTRLTEAADFVVVEGAGSPAETNLRSGDIANMGFAEAADMAVVLIGDIDRGGVIAQLAGTKAVISNTDAARIKGFLINKFRGDPGLFADGYAEIASRTGWRGLGIVPWFGDAAKLPAEDALDVKSAGTGGFHIAVPKLSRIANFDDIDPLKLEPGVRVTMVAPGNALPGDADLILIPGTKSTRGDLAFFREQGWDIDLTAHLRRGGHVLGICGGYQMLGTSLDDPLGVEGAPGRVTGLGWLDVTTHMAGDKTLTRTTARHLSSGEAVAGYEIHMGRTAGPDRERPLFDIDGRTEGAISACGRIIGTYLHGCFVSDRFRKAFLAAFGVASSTSFARDVETTLDALADHFERHIDIEGIIEIGLQQRTSFGCPNGLKERPERRRSTLEAEPGIERRLT